MRIERSNIFKKGNPLPKISYFNREGNLFIRDTSRLFYNRNLPERNIAATCIVNAININSANVIVMRFIIEILFECG